MPDPLRLVDRMPIGLVVAWSSIVRALAVLDAVALGAIIIYWIRTLPDHGALLGAATTPWLLYRGIKRAYRAIFEFDAVLVEQLALVARLLKPRLHRPGTLAPAKSPLRGWSRSPRPAEMRLL